MNRSVELTKAPHSENAPSRIERPSGGDLERIGMPARIPRRDYLAAEDANVEFIECGDRSCEVNTKEKKHQIAMERMPADVPIFGRQRRSFGRCRVSFLFPSRRFGGQRRDSERNWMGGRVAFW
jgi:hypothetical protein